MVKSPISIHFILKVTPKMKVRKLDNNNDMTFGSGNLNFHQDSIEGVAQNVYTVLSLWLGEWFLDTTAGTDWAGKCLGKNTTRSAENEIRRAVLGTDGVKEIVSLNTIYNRTNRQLTVDMSINTLFGNTSISITKEI